MRVCLLGDARSVHLRRLAMGLARRGLNIHVVSHKAVDIPGVSVEKFCVPTFDLWKPRRWKKRWAAYLRGFLCRFDVVNVHFLYDWGFEPEMLDSGCVVASPWGSDVVPPPGEGQPTPELTARRVELLRLAARVTAFGPTFARVVADYAGIADERIDVIPFGVDLELFQRNGKVRTGGRSYPLLEDRLASRRVGFFKGFREVYGAPYLVQAVPLVLRRLPDVRFDFIGDGAQLACCQALASELGMRHAIRWIARQPHEALPAWLGLWHLSVIPSLCEAFGVAALESQAMCVPVVASRVGGLQDAVLDGRTGLLVPPTSPEALAEAVIELLMDEGRRLSMGEAGRRWVAEHFDQERVLDHWIALYERVADRAAVVS